MCHKALQCYCQQSVFSCCSKKSWWWCCCCCYCCYCCCCSAVHCKCQAGQKVDQVSFDLPPTLDSHSFEEGS